MVKRKIRRKRKDKRKKREGNERKKIIHSKNLNSRILHCDVGHNPTRSQLYKTKSLIYYIFRL